MKALRDAAKKDSAVKEARADSLQTLMALQRLDVVCYTKLSLPYQLPPPTNLQLLSKMYEVICSNIVLRYHIHLLQR